MSDTMNREARRGYLANEFANMDDHQLDRVYPSSSRRWTALRGASLTM